jgi:hypothetical protein
MITRLKNDVLSNLKDSIPNNLHYYENDTSFLGEYLGSTIPINEPPVNLLIQKEKNEQLDYENSILLYNALKHLSPAEASEERMWVYMTHVTFWDYMRARWSISNSQGDKNNFIKTRYFYGEKPYSRNGIARLWWFAHITYNHDLEDPFELTKIMLKGQDQDLSRMIMESPNLVRNKVAVSIILKSIQKMEYQDFKTRDFVRFATKYLNLKGVVTVLSSLDYDDLGELVEDLTARWLKDTKKDLVKVTE